jgi:hypothetical protein
VQRSAKVAPLPIDPALAPFSICGTTSTRVVG